MSKPTIGLFVASILSVLLSCAQGTPSTALYGPQNETSVAPQKLTNDDIIKTPGGFFYRADGHQEGLPDFPAVQQTQFSFQALSGTIVVQYRDYIETKAGETRNNIMYLSSNNASELLDTLQVHYRVDDPPEGITFLEKDRMCKKPRTLTQ